MGKRPAHCYNRLTGPAYTRTAKTVVRKGFVRGVPACLVSQFDMGNARKEYPYQVLLVSEEDIQVQHNALEACRVAINKIVETEVGIENYHFQVRAYPHHVLRENAIITGAGADRLQTGMRHSFGKPKSRAARIKRGGLVYSIKVGTEKDVETARRALKSVKSKLPMKTSVQTKKL